MIAVLPADRDHLDALVESELGAAFGHPPIRDEEGDIVIRVGSTLVFLRTAADAQDVVLFSAVVHDIAGGRSRATEVLNDLNVESRWVKFQLVRDRVFVITSVPARPFVPAHLHQAVQVMSDVADGVDDELAGQAGRSDDVRRRWVIIARAGRAGRRSVTGPGRGSPTPQVGTNGPCRPSPTHTKIDHSVGLLDPRERQEH